MGRKKSAPSPERLKAIYANDQKIALLGVGTRMRPKDAKDRELELVVVAPSIEVLRAACDEFETELDPDTMREAYVVVPGYFTRLRAAVDWYSSASAEELAKDGGARAREVTLP